MAEQGSLRTSTSLLLAVVLLAEAATCLCVSPDDVDTARSDRETAFPSSSRFLTTAAVARRKMAGGRACRSGDPRECARQHLRCCGSACTDVLSSWNNCGACGKRCQFGRLCCAGRCVAVAYDVENCGACGRACAAGVPCTYGMCGYA